jgi:hypothetical protein
MTHGAPFSCVFEDLHNFTGIRPTTPRHSAALRQILLPDAENIPVWTASKSVVEKDPHADRASEREIISGSINAASFHVLLLPTTHTHATVPLTDEDPAHDTEPPFRPSTCGSGPSLRPPSARCKSIK